MWQNHTLHVRLPVDIQMCRDFFKGILGALLVLGGRLLLAIFQTVFYPPPDHLISDECSVPPHVPYWGWNSISFLFLMKPASQLPLVCGVNLLYFACFCSDFPIISHWFWEPISQHAAVSVAILPSHLPSVPIHHLFWGQSQSPTCFWSQPPTIFRGIVDSIVKIHLLSSTSP